MQRTWSIDVFACPKCDGGLELIAVIEDGAVAAKILRHLGLPTRAPPRGPPWRAQATLPLAVPGGAMDSVDPPAYVE